MKKLRIDDDTYKGVHELAIRLGVNVNELVSSMLIFAGMFLSVKFDVSELPDEARRIYPCEFFLLQESGLLKILPLSTCVTHGQSDEVLGVVSIDEFRKRYFH